MDVVGRHTLDALTVSEFDECVVAGRVEWVTVIPQLDQHPVAPERVDEPEQLTSGRGRAIGDECCGHRPLATAGEHPAMAGDGVSDIGERELRGALLTGEVPGAERPREPGVAGGAVGEHEQVRAGRIRSMRVGHHPGVDLVGGVAFGSCD